MKARRPAIMGARNPRSWERAPRWPPRGPPPPPALVRSAATDGGGGGGAQEGPAEASWRDTFVASSTAAASAVTPVGGFILKERILKA